MTDDCTTHPPTTLDGATPAIGRRRRVSINCSAAFCLSSNGLCRNTNNMTGPHEVPRMAQKGFHSGLVSQRRYHITHSPPAADRVPSSTRHARCLLFMQRVNFVRDRSGQRDRRRSAGLRPAYISQTRAVLLRGIIVAHERHLLVIRSIQSSGYSHFETDCRLLRN